MLGTALVVSTVAFPMVLLHHGTLKLGASLMTAGASLIMLIAGGLAARFRAQEQSMMMV